MKNLIAEKVTITILALLFCGCYAHALPYKAKQNSDITKAGGSDEMAPEFDLPDIDGKMFSSSSLKGKYVVIHIATTWCPFCNAEAPHLEQLYKEYKNMNVQVLIIDVKEPANLVAQKLRDRHNITFPILLDEDGAVATRFAPRDALPDLARDEVMLASNIIIDTSGKIRFMSLLDSQNFDAKLIGLKEKLNELLGESKTTGSINFIELRNAKPSRIKTGEQKTISISFQIKDGYHIQANRVNDERLIPAEISVSGQEGIRLGEPMFPEVKKFQPEGAEETLLVFDETMDVSIPVSVSSNQSQGDYLLAGLLKYQACDDRKCFYPREFGFEVGIRVVK